MEFQSRVIETNEQLWSAQVIQKFIRLDGIVSGIYYFEPAPIGHAKVAWQHWKINTRYYVSCTRIMYIVLTANSHRVVLLADYDVTSVFFSWRSAPATVPGLLQFPVRTTQCIQRRETTLCGTRGTRGNCIYSGAPRNCTYASVVDSCCNCLIYMKIGNTAWADLSGDWRNKSAFVVCWFYLRESRWLSDLVEFISALLSILLKRIANDQVTKFYSRSTIILEIV